ncbi:hypothetical protein D3C78_1977000 [compost metagenome]
MRKKLAALGFGLFFLAVVGTGIGYHKRCPAGYAVDSNLTMLAIYSLAGIEMCRP